MSKLLIALIAGAFALTVNAQTTSAAGTSPSTAPAATHAASAKSESTATAPSVKKSTKKHAKSRKVAPAEPAAAK